MKRISQLCPAGVPVNFSVNCRSFTLLTALMNVDVSFSVRSQTIEVAEKICAGCWYESDVPMTSITITSPIDQTVSFLVSQGRSGWKQPPPSTEKFSSDLSGTAASGFVRSNVIDLGDDWASPSLSAFCLAVTASVGAVLSIRCSDVPAMTDQSLAIARSNPNVQAYNTFGSTNQYIGAMTATGRYVRAEFQNGATIQGAGGKMSLVINRHQM